MPYPFIFFFSLDICAVDCYHYCCLSQTDMVKWSSVCQYACNFLFFVVGSQKESAQYNRSHRCCLSLVHWVQWHCGAVCQLPGESDDGGILSPWWWPGLLGNIVKPEPVIINVIAVHGVYALAHRQRHWWQEWSVQWRSHETLLSQSDWLQTSWGKL